MSARPQIALLIETSNAYARELLQGIRQYVREHQPWSLSLSERGRGAGLPPGLLRWKGQGIIARVENPGMAKQLRALDVPVVDVSNALERPSFPRVITDSRAATRLAANHLLERGLIHFGYCGDPRYHWSNIRSRFFGEHLGLARRACDIYSPARSGRTEVGEEAELRDIGRWIAGLPKPVGIMACYDMRGRQVLEACRRLGLPVPDEVAVIGVHNDELLCDLCDPPLTSVIPNASRAGYEAAALLARMLQGDSVPLIQVLLEPVGVAVRQSTDVVAVADPRISAAIRFMRDHACEGIDVTDVLKAVPMARSLFERRLKTALGRTPHEHLLSVRIERVKLLLATTDLPLVRIAERTGFEHVEYLSVAFKRVTGLAPSQWRLRHASRVMEPGRPTKIRGLPSAE